MKTLIGSGMILAGILLGLYVGIWICFIGGIMQFISAFQVTPISAYGIAVGVGKVFFATLFGWLSAALLIFPGAAMINSD